MMRPQPMVVVADVQGASTWFQEVLGLRSAHGGPEYEMLMDGEEMVLQLHRWEADEHPHLGAQTDPSRGNGLLLWFSTDDFEALVERASNARTKIIDGPLYNANGRQRELWLEGPEGYRVVVAGPRLLGEQESRSES